VTVPETINLADKFAGFNDHWNPRIVGRYNGHELRIAKLQGDFTWHAHSDTDELFFVVVGNLGIEFRDGVRRIAAGEMLVVPKGTEHRPFAEEEALVFMIDREGEPNTGGSPSDLTRASLETV
jgi:mannose-6-phosphate isomerase-like protein (cupin superfamily)